MTKKGYQLSRRICAWLLVISMLMPMLPHITLPAGASGTESEEPVTVIAGSDFQNASGHDAGAETVTTILQEIKDAGYTTAEGFLFAGDYDYGTSDSVAGKEKLQETVEAIYPDVNSVWVQGNHESDSLATDGTLSASGANDADAYGVYVINEKDYMWYNSSASTIQSTASALKSYLDAKIQAQYSKPIFVVSHLPLHYNMRTYNDGDGRYANYIFDVLNEAGEKGLNIIFLFGHDHSNGWDDYLGGSAIYLAKGDSINIAQASKTEFETETLNFTYMNAGYVGYYSNVNTGAETDLTMTVFEITSNEVTIARYSAEGLHDLKSVGVTNSYKNETAYSPDTRVYSSTQTVELNDVYTDSASGVTVAGFGISGLTVKKATSDIPSGYKVYQTYDILPAGFTEGNTATVTIPVDSSFDTSLPVLVIDHQKNKVSVAEIVNGSVTFTTNHFSMYTLAQADVETVSATGNIATYLKRVTALEAGVPYVISDYKKGWTLTDTSQDKGSHTGLLLDTTPSADHLWYIDANDRVVYGSADSTQYLLIAYKSGTTYGNVTIGTLDDTYAAITRYSNTNGGFEIFNSTTDKEYLNRHGGTDSDVVATAYTTASGSYWTFEQVFTNLAVTLTVTPSQNTVSTGSTVVLTPEVLVGDEAASAYTLTWESDDTTIATVSDDGIVTPVKGGQVKITGTLTAANGYALDAPISVEIPITVVTVTKDSSSVTASAVLDRTLLLSTSLKQNVSYVIVSWNTGWALTGNKDVDSGICVGLELVPEIDVDGENVPVWYYDGTSLLYGSATGSDNYLIYSDNKVTLGKYDSSLVFDEITLYGTNTYCIGNSNITTSTYKYLNHYGGDQYNAAGMYSNQYHSQWIFYEIGRNVSLSVSPAKSTLYPGHSITLEPTVYVNDESVSNNTLTWTSSDTSVATVDANGNVTAKSGGNVTITASLIAADGTDLGTTVSVEIPIKVINVSEDSTGITASVVLDKKLLPTTLTEGTASGPYVIVESVSGHALTGTFLQPGDEGYAGHNSLKGLQLISGISDEDAYSDSLPVWYYDGKHLLFGSATGSDNYLVYNDQKQVALGSADAANIFDKVTLYNSNNKTYNIWPSNVSTTSTDTNGNTTTTNYYLNQIGGSARNVVGVYSTASYSQWKLLKIMPERSVELKVTPALSKMYAGETAQLSTVVTMDGVEMSDYRVTWDTSDSSVATVYNGMVTTVSDGEVVITAALVSVSGEDLDSELFVEIPIEVVGVKSAELSANEGTVFQRTSAKANTGVTVTLTYEDNTTVTIPVTVNMLKDADGSRVSTYNAGTFSPLTVSYGGFVISSDFTLNVVEPELNDYPEYPDEGSVSVDKTGSGVDFQSSGVAQIELSATGVPVKTGADVIIMLDTSTSMGQEVDGALRIEVLAESLNNLMNQLQAKDASGQPMDIRVAVADFNTYYNDQEYSFYYNDPKDTVTGGGSQGRTYYNDPKVYTGSGKLDAGAFVDVYSLGEDPFAAVATDGKITLKRQYGTNYDYAFDAIYQMGEAILEANSTGEERDLFVIFMSDGSPFQYNYFSAGSGHTYWNNWLTATMTDEMFAEGSDRSFYNEKGLHWMAEAIKGDPTKDYQVIRKNDSRDTDKDNWITVPGLGATMYSIGFCLAQDNLILETTMDTVIQKVASSPEFYFKADTANELKDAFNLITNEIFYAATDAYFIDTMGPNFDLQMGDRECLNDTIIKPVIQVKSYSIYTNQDLLDGLCTVDQVGNRKTDANGNYIYTLLEEVTFNEDGTEAYSNVLGSTTNILKNGVICANTFWYNSTSAAVDITLSNGSTYSLPTETFYWKLGTISTTELVLSYYVYLTGSMEGLRSAGTYDTNAYAELFYTNYLGHNCSKTVPTPKLPWQQATVGYGFYLVDVNGNPIVNQTTGATGSFQNAVKITQPVYQNFLLNSGSQDIMASIVAGSLLPDGYTLFDEDAKYEVQQSSDGAGYYIIYTDGSGKQTTYVVGATSVPVTGGDADGEKVETENFATANTVVWFGVVATVNCMPDTVVIDYGIPVDIHPLINDLMMPTGTVKLVGIGKSHSSAFTAELDSSFVGINTELIGTFGKAMIKNDGYANSYDGAIRYTLNTDNGMQMNQEETFSYAVYYSGPVATNGYYYSTVTVIPATSIYYEDSFVTYKTYEYTSDVMYSKDDAKYRGTEATDVTSTNQQWTQVGETLDRTQGEDRPGSFNLSYMDVNNIYGFDGAYKNLTTYSMGSAMKITATSKANTAEGMEGTYDKTYGTAEFTFYGTGFDVISVTSDTTGFITVQVYAITETKAADGTVTTTEKLAKATLVDTYYGYRWAKIDTDDDGEPDTWSWIVDTENTDASGDTGALYQVPVIKIDGLTYGKYRAVITASYAEAFDHNEKDNTDGGQYDFYLDAIRIYDPANDGVKTDADGNQTVNNTVQDAYLADGECWPEYFELRNMVITKDTFDSMTDDAISGIVFIDDANTENGKVPTVQDYANYGPNNELYLAPGQSVTFALNVPGDVAAIHLALKTVGGGTAQAKIHNPQNTSVPYSALTTSTELYHNITVLNGKNVLISNSADSEAIVSITNIKVTYTKEHVDSGANSPDVLGISMFSVDRSVVEQALNCLTYSAAPDISEEETSAESTEAETPVESEEESTEAETSGEAEEETTEAETSGEAEEDNAEAETSGEAEEESTEAETSGKAEEENTEVETPVGNDEDNTEVEAPAETPTEGDEDVDDEEGAEIPSETDDDKADEPAETEGEDEEPSTEEEKQAGTTTGAENSNGAIGAIVIVAVICVLAGVGIWWYRRRK